MAPIFAVSQLFGLLLSRKNQEILSFSNRPFCSIFNFMHLTWKSFVVFIETIGGKRSCMFGVPGEKIHDKFIYFKSQKFINFLFYKLVVDFTVASLLIVYYLATLVEFLFFILLPIKWFKLQKKWEMMEHQINRLINHSIF